MAQQPLNNKNPIVNPDGTPNDYFIRLLQDIGITISDGMTAEEVIVLIEEALSNHTIGAGVGLSGGGALVTDPVINLDAVLNDLNDVDTVSSPPTDQQVLGFDAGASLWVPIDQSGGGGGGGGSIAIRPTVRQIATVAGNGSTYTFPAAPVSGNLMVVLTTHWSGVTVNTDWLQIRNAVGAVTDGNFIASRIVTPSDTAVQTPLTVSGSVSGMSGVMYEIENHGGLLYLPFDLFQESVSATGRLDFGIPTDTSLLIGAFATVLANTAPIGITGATAGTTVQGTSTQASPRQVTPFQANVEEGGVTVVATYAGTPRQNGMGVVIPPRMIAGSGLPWYFNPPSAANFTTLIHGGVSADASVSDDTDVGMVVRSNTLAAVANAQRGALVALPGGGVDWDLVTHAGYATGGYTGAAGLMIAQVASSTSASITLAGPQGVTNGLQWWRGSLTAYTAVVGSNSYGIDAPMWQRFSRVGANILFYVSQDGKNWVLNFSSPVATSFSTGPTHIGFGFQQTTASAREMYITCDHWVQSW